MRHLVFVAFVIVGCSAVDAPPLGGPYGGSTGQTDPNGDNPTDNPTDDAGTQQQQGDDAGQQQQQQDSGTQQQQKDSGTQQQQQDAGQQQQQNNAPTWTDIFNSYLGSGTSGKCNSCHSEGSSATKLYSWLQGKGYINGTSSTLVNKSKSILSWYGGDMPPSGPTSDAQAVTDMNAWAAAGAQNN